MRSILHLFDCEALNFHRQKDKKDCLPLLQDIKRPLFFVLFFIPLCLTGSAQDSHPPAAGLFDSDQVLNIRLSGNLRELLKDKSDEMQYHDMALSYVASDSSLVSIPLKIKTRGHFRRTQGNCTYPPLLLSFSKGHTPKNSLFHNQDKMKLVTPCTGDKYVVREYLVYKLYNLINPKSFRARLVKVVYDDTVKAKKSQPLYGILLEDEDQMARRNNTVIVKGRLVKPERTRQEEFLKMAVFEYMIGNTDWSVQYYQNIKLIAADSMSIPTTVPYDFDHAGIVEAPYANPAEQLLLNSTRDRRYRGYCVSSMPAFNDIFALFNRLKEDIYAVYTKCPWLEDSYKMNTVRFLDEFYKTINNPISAKSEFTYPCDKDGTGNVVIKGLNKSKKPN